MMNQENFDALPHWDLSTLYPGLDSPQFNQAMGDFSSQIAELQSFMEQAGIGAPGESQAGADAFPQALNGYLERMNALLRLSNSLRAYIWSFVATDSFNDTARRLLSEFEQRQVAMRIADTSFSAWLGGRADRLPAALESGEPAKSHAFYLQERFEQSRYLMSEPEESLAAELALSGASAWGRLQGVVCSQLSVAFDSGAGPQPLPVAALQNLSHDPDPDIRRRAYLAELAAWETVREPLAAALNGVKGAAIVLNQRRGRRDALHAALDQARIDRPTLDAMLAAMRESFPAFRDYLRAKARLLGHPGGLPWYDLFAPISAQERTYSWSEASDFIVTQFNSFSPRLAALAGRAFAGNWIDAEPRAGKRGGAFCMSVDAVDESRILCNFDGSLDQVFTVAHELGHAFHNNCFGGKPRLQTVTPMTLAETASIFCETIVTDAVLAQAASPAEELAILEPALMGAAQIIVDISSRFTFESEVFERRAQAELSADEFCEMMLKAQVGAYGDGLDESCLHKYMWAWKPHYYRADLNFYNFPYAFGMLFGLGLYSIYQERGPAFVADYENLLASTGEGEAASLAARFGIDLRSPAFWRSSLEVLERRVERYVELTT